MKSILITLVLSILMNLAPAIEHDTETLTSVEQLSNESHAGMNHEMSGNECCHDNCICCVSTSYAIRTYLEAEISSVSIVISFSMPNTNAPYLDIYLRPPILSQT